MWFTISHMLLPSGSTVADMACSDGVMTYTMSVLKPDINFIGVDKNSGLMKLARSKFKRNNLEFKVGNINGNTFEENSLDGIIDSFILHEKYSGSSYNDDTVRETLKDQFLFLRDDGLIFIRDYAMPPPEEFVLMELPDEKSHGSSLHHMSEADLLIWFSESAHPKESNGCGGFYLEELPPRFPKTRLFRLPHKWAYEFIMRKDDRSKWEDELPKEYTFYTDHDYRKVLRNLGTRVLYTAPHWDDNIIKNNFEGKFRMFDEDRNYLGHPPTSFVALAQKIGEMKSLVLHEKRISRSNSGSITISSVKNKKTGQLIDVISRGLELAEVIPYRVTKDGKLMVYLHEGRPRGLVNAVPRAGTQIDGKRWSGHMTEAITIDSEHVKSIIPGDYKNTLKFAKNFLGLKPSNTKTIIEKGPGYYPDPSHIDERIETYYMEVCDPKGKIEPVEFHNETGEFSFKGKIRELDAQYVLNAITVGFLPNSRLETQLLALFQKLGIRSESWAESPLALKEEEIENVLNVREILEEYTKPTNDYKDSKGSAGQFKLVQSVFVDEGQKKGGGMAGLASENIQFALSEENTINSVVVLPLTKDLNGEVMAGVVKEFLPIPERYAGNGMTVTAPRFDLPKEITNMEEAKKFVADQFEVPVEQVCRLGESFFTHIGVTPHKVYPFAVANVLDFYDGTAHGTTDFAPIVDLWQLLYWDNHDSFIKVVAMSYQQFCGETELGMFNQLSTKMEGELTAPITSTALDSPSINKSSETGYSHSSFTPSSVESASLASEKNSSNGIQTSKELTRKLK